MGQNKFLNYFSMKILIINGPNLNLLGKREPHIYGKEYFETFLERLREKFTDIHILFYQSNSEGSLIDRMHAAMNEGIDGIILNAGAYTHYSLALHDAIKAIEIPVVEVHISNIHAREQFRRQSVIAPACVGSITGFGLVSYEMALYYFINQKQ